MITVVSQGGLGEQMFQYAFSRILAAKYGYALHAQPIFGFPNTYERQSGETDLSPNQDGEV